MVDKNEEVENNGGGDSITGKLITNGAVETLQVEAVNISEFFQEKQLKKTSVERKRWEEILEAVDKDDLGEDFAREMIEKKYTLDEVEHIIRCRKDKNFKRSTADEFPAWVQFTLPVDGGVCRYTKSQGKHIRRASDIAGTDQSRMGFALTAQTLTLDGKPVRMEDIDEMDDDDVTAIMQHKGNFKLGWKS